MAVMCLGGLLVATPALAAAATKARAQAVAKAVNLTAADLPGFAGSPSRTTASDRRYSAMLATCSGGVPPSKSLVNVFSPDFTMEPPGGLAHQEVSSNVSVLPSAKLVAQDLRSVKSARGRACLAKATGQLLKSMKVKGVTYGPVTITQLKRHAPGSDGSFAYRVRIDARASGLRIPFYVDAIGFSLGRAEVGLTTLGISEPFPATVEQSLLTLLAGRASYNHL